MKKLYILPLIALSSALLLSGCGKSSSSDVIKPATETIPESNVEVSDASENLSTDEDLPPKEGMVRSRITNEWVDEDLNNTRPIAIMIPNTNTASYYGLSKADILYECNVEGSMTRLMAIINDWKSLNKIGNIRSARDYYVYWGFEWDAIYIHYGGPFYIDDVVERDDTQNINCLTYNDGYFQEEARNSTDDCFTSGDRIEKALGRFGYSDKYRDGYADATHYSFAPFNAPNLLNQYEDSIDAIKIDMSPCYPVTNCYFVYNEDTESYDRYQRLSGGADAPHIDEANNEQLSFTNVIVQNTYHEVRDQKGYLAFQVHDDSRDGWYFTKGKGVHVNWKKVTDYGATRYFDDDGNEIQLNTGKTMVLIVEAGDSFSVDDKLITPSK